MTLHYERGHDMAGYRTLRVAGDGTAEASLSGTGDLGRRSTSATLTAAQRDRLADAMAGAGLARLTGSTRTPLEDEVPVLITLGEGDDRREILVWEQDVEQIPGFADFEATVSDIVDEILAGHAAPGGHRQ